MKEQCGKCGTRLILVWVGKKIPWLACPLCDKEELKNSANKE